MVNFAKPIKKLRLQWVGFATIVLIFLACNYSPTVPLPPPEAIVTWTDEEGVIRVAGGSEEAVEGDIAMVFNEDSETGYMNPVAADGTFEIELEAEPGDTLIVQIKHGDELSEETILEVPSG